MPAAETNAEFRDQLKASIQQRVDRELRAAFESVERSGGDQDDESVDELAGRTAGLGDVIAARVEAALRKRG